MKNILLIAVAATFLCGCTGNIQGSFYSDANSNKVKDTGEEALPFVMFKVTRDGEKVGNAVTNAMGEYHLKVKGGGYYCIEVLKESLSKQNGATTGTGGTAPAEGQSAITAKASTTSSGTASCYTSYNCGTGQSCINGVCTVPSAEDEDEDADKEDEDGDTDNDADTDNDNDNDNTDSGTTGNTTQAVVRDSGKVCEQITRNKYGLDVPIFVSFGNLAKLPKPEKIKIPLRKTRTIFFTYPESATFDKVYLPSIVVPAGEGTIKNYSYNMVDLSSSPALPIPGLDFGLDESVLVKKGFIVTGNTIGTGYISAEVEGPTGTISLPTQEIEVVAEYPGISQKIVGSGKPKAGEKFKIEINIDNEIRASLDSVQLVFTPSPYIDDITGYDADCENRGSEIACPLTFGDQTEITRIFTIELPDSVDTNKNFLFTAKLICKVGDEEKEIKAGDIGFVLVNED